MEPPGAWRSHAPSNREVCAIPPWSVRSQPLVGWPAAPLDLHPNQVISPGNKPPNANIEYDAGKIEGEEVMARHHVPGRPATRRSYRWLVVGVAVGVVFAGCGKAQESLRLPNGPLAGWLVASCL